MCDACNWTCITSDGRIHVLLWSCEMVSYYFDWLWQKLNNVMSKNGVHNPNFKGLMVNNAQTNWNVV
jgi:hypothetical protein